MAGQHDAELHHAAQVAALDQLLHGIDAQVALLAEVAESLRGSGAALAISEKATQPMLTTDFPFAGSHRWLIPRQPQGGLVALAAGKAVQVLADNPARLGAYIVNLGGKTADLFLCDGNRAQGSKAGLGRVRLAAGEAWDCRLGPNLLWSGSIAAESGEGSELSVAEV